MNTATLTTWARSVARPKGLTVDYEFDKLCGRFQWIFRQNDRKIKAVIDPKNLICVAEKIVVDNSK